MGRAWGDRSRRSRTCRRMATSDALGAICAFESGKLPAKYLPRVSCEWRWLMNVRHGKESMPSEVVASSRTDDDHASAMRFSPVDDFVARSHGITERRA